MLSIILGLLRLLPVHLPTYFIDHLRTSANIEAGKLPNRLRQDPKQLSE
jgi:hypothetical protein